MACRVFPGSLHGWRALSFVVILRVADACAESGLDWNALALRAADHSGEAGVLLLEADAERHQAAVDTAWREPQLRLGVSQGEADEETPRGAWPPVPIRQVSRQSPTCVLANGRPSIQMPTRLVCVSTLSAPL